MTQEEGYAKARAILEDMHKLYAERYESDLDNITVCTEGYGSRNMPGTKMLMGVEVPNVEHFLIVAAQGAVTAPSEKFQLRVTMEVPSKGWNDDLVRRFLAEGVQALT